MSIATMLYLQQLQGSTLTDQDISNEILAGELESAEQKVKAAEAAKADAEAAKEKAEAEAEAAKAEAAKAEAKAKAEAEAEPVPAAKAEGVTPTIPTNPESAVITGDNAEIKKRRAAIIEKCTDTSTVEDTTASIGKDFFNFLPEPTASKFPSTPKPNFKRCKNVVLDFGANVGDTAGHLIDAGLPSCPSKVPKQHLTYPRLLLGDRSLEVGKWNMVTKFLKEMMGAISLYPEDYCYYGIEGNPVFTERLQGIENYINAIEPKPLIHASFLTESVGAGEFGMTKLYLDTVNTKENFWGSSIMKGHQDVKKSTGEDQEAPSHDVMGYTITKLMDLTLLGMKPDATEDEKKGAHFLLKVDIEGGEYVLTQEVVESKALCKFVEMGNTVDVVIETHSQRVTGPNPLARKFGGWRDELTKCGVTFRNLQAWWA
jgi:hypothetical protein